ncbi:hypothetical protein H2199_004592 [Coniosporium tulheliwenetii]|uniref:Uncharacterized protein n=1 Tax=Coniosporium tulheliwenetii TaxID=3383036 RepID=A0ACC2Z703_9PEZI|nr:hypothetical protein H2199_004592 [Cladosporium sp. JES 115]
MSKIEKTIARQQQKIEEGQYYEAHQQLRVIASRYVKQSNWDAACDLLFSGAQLLLKAGQGGSGGDLCLFLVDTYNKAELKPDAASKGRLLALLRVPAGRANEEEIRHRYDRVSILPMTLGTFTDLAQMVLEVWRDEAYDAERHLVLGTRDSPERLARLEYDWYTEDEPHTAPLYVARAVLPYLLTGNMRSANQSMLLFTGRLQKRKVVSAAKRGSADLFRQLKSHYAVHLKEVGTWDEALAQIGEMYFGIKIPSQTNPLMDMMGNMLMGGGLGGAPKPKSKRVEAPAPAPAVD